MAVSNKDQAKVFAACEQLVDEAVELLVDLIKIPSENPGYKYDEKLYTDRGYTDLYDEPITRGGRLASTSFSSLYWPSCVTRPTSWPPTR